mmetsp:Transcript_51904/g.60015  ORF Transcript_51904/g.60015 Transcript_51904/m.60015 type:complete len:91 (+) Transcript_51904:131-403(+)
MVGQPGILVSISISISSLLAYDDADDIMEDDVGTFLFLFCTTTTMATFPSCGSHDVVSAWFVSCATTLPLLQQQHQVLSFRTGGQYHSSC